MEKSGKLCVPANVRFSVNHGAGTLRADGGAHLRRNGLAKGSGRRQYERRTSWMLTRNASLHHILGFMALLMGLMFYLSSPDKHALFVHIELIIRLLNKMFEEQENNPVYCLKSTGNNSRRFIFVNKQAIEGVQRLVSVTKRTVHVKLKQYFCSSCIRLAVMNSSD